MTQSASGEHGLQPVVKGTGFSPYNHRSEMDSGLQPLRENSCRRRKIGLETARG